VGVCLGTSVGCSFNSESFWRDHLGNGSPDVSVVDRYYGNDLSTLVSARLGASGPASTVVNACASGTDAVGLACQWIACGLCDVVVAGGADHIERFGYHGFVSLKNMSPTRCRPFDRNRDGLSLGEGAGALVLELEEHASRRRARPLGVVLGYASAADAYHPTAPHPGGRGLRRAIAGALAEAGLAIRDVGFVNAHATATIENDRVEGRVLADVLHPGTLVTCTKGYTGHTLGASGAIEAIISIENLSGGWVPASIGFEEVDPETGIEPVRSLARHGAGVALSISLAFGGTNSAIVLGAP
jgi:3-oxoacyl-(acyl-carrier-protein) synthase